MAKNCAAPGMTKLLPGRRQLSSGGFCPLAPGAHGPGGSRGSDRKGTLARAREAGPAVPAAAGGGQKSLGAPAAALGLTV